MLRLRILVSFALGDLSQSRLNRDNYMITSERALVQIHISTSPQVKSALLFRRKYQKHINVIYIYRYLTYISHLFTDFFDIYLRG